MGWGLTDLRFAVESQSWRRRRRIADCGPDVFGVRDDGATGEYVPRDVDAAVEAAVGSDRPLVVVTGDRLAGSSRTLHRAARRMLGDRWVLPLREPHIVDLADALRFAGRIARRSGPVVVAVDDAPPALLDQLTDETYALLGGDVRLLLTSRRSFLGAFPAEDTRARLRAATVEVPPASDGRPFGERVRPLGRARAVLDPVGWSSLLPLALLRAVVDWERLGVTTALTPEVLAAIAPIYTVPLGVPTPSDADLRDAIRAGWRTDHGGMRLWRRTRRRGEPHLVADRVFSHLADAEPGTAGWEVPDALVQVLRKRGDAAERYRLARVALARGEQHLAVRLCADLPPTGLEPQAAFLIGTGLASPPAGPSSVSEQGKTLAASWFHSVIDRAEGPVLGMARQQAGFLEFGRGRYREAVHHLPRGHRRPVQPEDAGCGPRRRGAHRRSRGGPPLVRAGGAGRGPGDRGPGRPGGRRAPGRGGARRRRRANAGAGVGLAVPRSRGRRRPRARSPGRRRGQRRRAIELLLGLLEWVEEGDDRTRALVELGKLRNDDGDADGAATAFRRAKRGGGPAGHEAAVLLAELELSREDWDAVEAAAADLVDGFHVGRRDPQLQARLLAARGEAALRRGDLPTARRCFEALRRAEGRLGELGAVRLGQVLSRMGDPVAAYGVLHPMQQAADPALAARARELVRRLGPQVQHIQSAAAVQRNVAAQAARFIAPA